MLLIATTILISGKNPKNTAVSASAAFLTGFVPVIDAGHGGADGGAVSLSGALESEINLDIALKMEQIFAFYGVPPVMTRRSNEINYSKNSKTIREKKVEDQKNRVKLVNSTDNPVLISIHQNTYGSGTISGAQVFYAATDASREFALSMQQILTTSLDMTNPRMIVKAPKNIYLMANINCPAILIECGFLSNKVEDALLQTESYRLKIAATIAAGYLNFEQMR